MMLITLACAFGVFYVGTTTGTKSTNLLDFGSSIRLEPFDNTLDAGCITEDTGPLICDDFSKKCAYAPAGPESKWNIGHGTVDKADDWNDSVGTSISPVDPFLVARFSSDTEPFATLTSKTVSCVQGGAFDEVMFNFWATPDVTLHVCLVDAQSGANVLCSDRFSSASSGYPGFFRFKISRPIASPFKIQYFAETIPGQQGFLILDDIGYYGSFCGAAAKCSPSSTSGGGGGSTAAASTTQAAAATTTVSRALEEASTTTTTTRLPIRTTTTTTPRTTTTTTTTTTTMKTTTMKTTTTTTTPTKTAPDVCKVVRSCDFESGTCGFTSTGGNVLFKSSRGDFINSPPVPRTFQIRNSRGYYMGAAVKINSNDLAILSSPQFASSAGKTLTFNFYRLAIGATLKICFDVAGRTSSDQSKRQCAQQIPPLSGSNAMSWNLFTVAIPASAGQFHFVAMSDGATTNGNYPAAIGIDDIKISGC